MKKLGIFFSLFIFFSCSKIELTKKTNDSSEQMEELIQCKIANYSSLTKKLDEPLLLFKEKVTKKICEDAYFKIYVGGVDFQIDGKKVGCFSVNNSNYEFDSVARLEFANNKDNLIEHRICRKNITPDYDVNRCVTHLKLKDDPAYSIIKNIEKKSIEEIGCLNNLEILEEHKCRDKSEIIELGPYLLSSISIFGNSRDFKKFEELTCEDPFLKHQDYVDVDTAFESIFKEALERWKDELNCKQSKHSHQNLDCNEFSSNSISIKLDEAKEDWFRVRFQYFDKCEENAEKLYQKNKSKMLLRHKDFLEEVFKNTESFNNKEIRANYWNRNFYNLVSINKCILVFDEFFKIKSSNLFDLNNKNLKTLNRNLKRSQFPQTKKNVCKIVKNYSNGNSVPFGPHFVMGFELYPLEKENCDYFFSKLDLKHTCEQESLGHPNGEVSSISLKYNDKKLSSYICFNNNSFISEIKFTKLMKEQNLECSIQSGVASCGQKAKLGTKLFLKLNQDRIIRAEVKIMNPMGLKDVFEHFSSWTKILEIDENEVNILNMKLDKLFKTSNELNKLSSNNYQLDFFWMTDAYFPVPVLDRISIHKI